MFFWEFCWVYFDLIALVQKLITFLPWINSIKSSDVFYLEYTYGEVGCFLMAIIAIGCEVASTGLKLPP